MILQEKQQKSSRLSKHRKKKNKLLWRIVFLLICCFIFFWLGRYFVMAMEAFSGNESLATVANQSKEDYIEDLDESKMNINTASDDSNGDDISLTSESDADEEKLESNNQDKSNYYF